MTVATLVTMPDLAFPEPPRPDEPAQPGQSTPADFAALADELRRENAAISAERDRAVAEAKRLRDEREATGLYRVVGVIAEGVGAAVALVLTFGVLAALVAAVMFAFGWRP